MSCRCLVPWTRTTLHGWRLFSGIHDGLRFGAGCRGRAFTAAPRAVARTRRGCSIIRGGRAWDDSASPTLRKSSATAVVNLRMMLAHEQQAYSELRQRDGSMLGVLTVCRNCRPSRSPRRSLRRSGARHCVTIPTAGGALRGADARGDAEHRRFPRRSGRAARVVRPG